MAKKKVVETEEDKVLGTEAGAEGAEATVASEEKATKKAKKVEYPEVITFVTAHPEMEFEKFDDNGVMKERIGKQYHHAKRDENGEIVYQKRSFSADVHGENYVEVAKEFYETNRSKVVDGKETGKPVITSHNLPVAEDGTAL